MVWDGICLVVALEGSCGGGWDVSWYDYFAGSQWWWYGCALQDRTR